jgi:hypothetical protein
MAKPKSKAKIKVNANALSTVAGSEEALRAQGYKKIEVYSVPREPVYGNMRWLAAIQSVGLSDETIGQIVNHVKSSREL